MKTQTLRSESAAAVCEISFFKHRKFILIPDVDYECLEKFLRMDSVSSGATANQFKNQF